MSLTAIEHLQIYDIFYDTNSGFRFTVNCENIAILFLKTALMGIIKIQE